MEERQQRKLEKGGEKAGVGRFRHASLESNKKLKMFNETSRSSSGEAARDSESLRPYPRSQ